MKEINRLIELLRVELKLTETTEPDGLTGVYLRVEQLEEVVKSLNIPVVSKSFCGNCGKELDADDNFLTYCRNCSTLIEQNVC